MPQSSKVNMTDEDNSVQVAGAVLGIAAMEGVMERGPINRPDILITTVTQLRKLHGKSVDGTDFQSQVEKVIAAGGRVRVNNIRHYTDITDKSTLSADVAVLAAIKDTVVDPDVVVFTGVSKYPGVKYNSVKFVIKNASNAVASNFDLDIFILGEETETIEKYKNLSIKLPNGVAGNSHFLDAVNQASELVKLSYVDLTPSANTQLRPLNGTYAFSGGSNGDAVAPTDYIGDSTAKTGLFAFDGFDDFSDITIPVISDEDVNLALLEYANTRKDVQALIHIDEALTTAADIVEARGDGDSRYAAFFAGGVTTRDPNTKDITNHSEIADMLIILQRNDKVNYPWISPAGKTKGLIRDAFGVINNFGTPALLPDLELLSENQINAVVNAGGKTYLKGNFSGQKGDSKASYFHIVRGLINLKKTIKPVLEDYLEEPANIPTFIKLFNEIKPTLDNMTTKQFFYKGKGKDGAGYTWNGDQDAVSIDNLLYNTPEDLDKGIYNIGLDVYPINSIQVINMKISLNALTNNVDIEINL